MNEKQYSLQLAALEIPGRGYVPLEESFVESYDLKEGMMTPYSGYKVVARKSDWDLKRCLHCNTDLLVLPTDTFCPFCQTGFRPSFSFP